MGRNQFLSFLLLSALLFSVSLPQGNGRRIKIVKHYDLGHSFKPSLEKIWNAREMAEMVMDYKEPVANTNPKSGVSPPSNPQP